MNNSKKLISMNEVCEITSLSRTAINKHRNAGKFPAAVSLGESRMAFVLLEVEAWIEDRINARQPQTKNVEAA